MVHQVKSHLYTPDQILNFVKDIEGDLQAMCDTLKAGGNPSKRCAYCLFVDNLSGAMSIPTDPAYCLVYPTSYVKGIKPDHFDTCNSPAGTHLHHCVCCTTLQFSNDDPKERTRYVRSCLILPHGAQYNNRLYPAILEIQNYCSRLIDPATGEPYPMEVWVILGPWILSLKGVMGTLSCIPMNGPVFCKLTILYMLQHCIN